MANNEKLGSIGEDFDGVHTLRSDEGYKAVFANVLTDLGIFLTEKDFTERLYRHWGAAMATILTEDMLPDRNDLWGKGIKILKENMMEILPDIIEPVPGAAESTERLSAQYNLALISAADHDVLMEKLFPKVGLKPEYFQGGIYTADRMDPGLGQRPKPDPYALNDMMRRTGTIPAHTLMVGDSRTDVDSARNAGVEPVVTLTGNLSRADAEEMKVGLIIEDITQLETEVIPQTLGRLGLGKYSWNGGSPPDGKGWLPDRRTSLV